MSTPLDYRPDFSATEWSVAWARVLARLTEAQREVLAATWALPTPEEFAEVSQEGPAQWLSEGGNPSLQAMWSLALRELLPAELPTVTVEQREWREPRIVAANVILTQPTQWSAPVVFLGSVRAAHPLLDRGPDSCVTVVGALSAPGLFTSGDMQLLGDVDVPFIEGSGSNNMLLVLGDVRSQVIFEEGHASSWAGQVEARAHATFAELPATQEQKLEEALLPEFLSESRPYLGLATQAAAEGRVVLRAPPEGE
ncbi:hypothetical protein DRW03_03145 [Corallococcus sp. H22C18031201]|nr:hypothetical protein DRW03_03145 [Corallococcus sp. H22C18031201]